MDLSEVVRKPTIDKQPVSTNKIRHPMHDADADSNESISVIIDDEWLDEAKNAKKRYTDVLKKKDAVMFVEQQLPQESKTETKIRGATIDIVI